MNGNKVAITSTRYEYLNMVNGDNQMSTGSTCNQIESRSSENTYFFFFFPNPNNPIFFFFLGSSLSTSSYPPSSSSSSSSAAATSSCSSSSCSSFFFFFPPALAFFGFSATFLPLDFLSCFLFLPFFLPPHSLPPIGTGLKSSLGWNSFSPSRNTYGKHVEPPEWQQSIIATQ